MESKNEKLQAAIDWMREHPLKAAGLVALTDLGLLGIASLMVGSLIPLALGVMAVVALLGVVAVKLVEVGLSNY